MKKIFMPLGIILSVLCAGGVLFAAEVDANKLLAILDNNEVALSIQYSGEMIIEYKSKRFVKTFNSWGRENTDFFMEFTNSEDKGTKYLKKDGRLYVYSPDTEKVILISGSMLRESMMGSDLSYEDAVSNRKLQDAYTPSIDGSLTYQGREVWVLKLEAKDKKRESYASRVLYVDKENDDVLHSEYFALSGAKLKEYELLKTEVIGKRRFPVEFEMRDLLRKDSKTTFKMASVVLDAKIADSVFSQRNLER